MYNIHSPVPLTLKSPRLLFYLSLTEVGDSPNFTIQFKKYSYNWKFWDLFIHAQLGGIIFLKKPSKFGVILYDDAGCLKACFCAVLGWFAQFQTKARYFL